MIHSVWLLIIWLESPTWTLARAIYGKGFPAWSVIVITTINTKNIIITIKIRTMRKVGPNWGRVAESRGGTLLTAKSVLPPSSIIWVIAIKTRRCWSCLLTRQRLKWPNLDCNPQELGFPWMLLLYWWYYLNLNMQELMKLSLSSLSISASSSTSSKPIW